MEKEVIGESNQSIGNALPEKHIHASKSEAFKRLGTKRVQQVLTQLRVLGNCANRSNYEYTDEQVEKIMDTLTLAFADLKSKFKPEPKSEAAKFTL